MHISTQKHLKLFHMRNCLHRIQESMLRLVKPDRDSKVYTNTPQNDDDESQHLFEMAEFHILTETISLALNNSLNCLWELNLHLNVELLI